MGKLETILELMVLSGLDGQCYSFKDKDRCKFEVTYYNHLRSWYVHCDAVGFSVSKSVGDTPQDVVIYCNKIREFILGK